MAKVFDKLKNLMFPEYEDDPYYDYDDPDGEYEYEEPPARESRHTTQLRDVSRDREPEYSSPSPSRKTGGASNRSSSNVYSLDTSVQMQVVIIQPLQYEDAQQICDQIKVRKPVVVNLEEVEYPVAQRIMDFLSGTCYSLEGSIQRVANNIFVIAPEGVQIEAELREKLKSKSVAFPWASNGK